MITSLGEFRTHAMLEMAKSLADIEERSVSLVAQKNNTGVNFCLCNPKNGAVYAYMYVYDAKTYYLVGRSVAIDSYGPALYTAAMAWCNEQDPKKGLRPSRTIKPEALNVWKYFVKNNTSLTAYPVFKDDKWSWFDYSSDVTYVKKPEELNILNHTYTINIDQDWKKFLDLSQAVQDDMSPMQIQDVLRKGNNLYHKYY